MRSSSGILPTDYGFTHQRSDATTGLDDYGARWYDPVAGQFASADTTLAGGLNRYAYVAGNPETNTDPSGHVVGDPDTEVTEFFNAGPTNTGAPEASGINLGPLIGGIGATLAAFGLWVHSQFVSAPTPARPPVLARSQSNAMAAWNAYVPPSADTRHQTNALDAAQIASGGGGGGGSGTVPRTPPPTENGEAIGFGAPILAEDVLAECDPQLPTAQYCIGWTRYGRVVNSPQQLAHERAQALQNELPEASRGRVTMGVGVTSDGEILVGTSEGGYLRKGVTLDDGEVLAPGDTHHAEQNILQYAGQQGIDVVAVGAGRPICDACRDAIKDTIGESGIASPTKSGFVPPWMQE